MIYVVYLFLISYYRILCSEKKSSLLNISINSPLPLRHVPLFQAAGSQMWGILISFNNDTVLLLLDGLM